jgi:hypothetical protein
VFGKYGGLCENAANLLGDVLGAMQGCWWKFCFKYGIVLADDWWIKFGVISLMLSEGMVFSRSFLFFDA